MDPVTALTCVIVVAIVCGAIVAVLIVAFVSQALQTRSLRKRAITAERTLARRHAADRVRENQRLDVMATARATTRARRTDDMTLASAELDPSATVEIVSYRNPTPRELVAWRNGSRQG